jgi:hypothetical protein
VASTRGFLLLPPPPPANQTRRVDATVSNVICTYMTTTRGFASCASWVTTVRAGSVVADTLVALPHGTSQFDAHAALEAFVADMSPPMFPPGFFPEIGITDMSGEVGSHPPPGVSAHYL